MVEPTFVIAVLGDGGSGKTSLIERFATNSFAEQRSPTLGLDMWMQRMRLDGRGTVKLQIWEVGAGAETDRAVFSRVDGILVTHDVTRGVSSILSARNWFESIEGLAPSSACRMLVGTKDDAALPPQLSAAASKHGRRLAEELRISSVATVSSADGTGVSEVFALLAARGCVLSHSLIRSLTDRLTHSLARSLTHSRSPTIWRRCSRFSPRGCSTCERPATPCASATHSRRSACGSSSGSGESTLPF